MRRIRIHIRSAGAFILEPRIQFGVPWHLHSYFPYRTAFAQPVKAGSQIGSGGAGPRRRVRPRPGKPKPL